jgi:hypothetical protein
MNALKTWMRNVRLPTLHLPSCRLTQNPIRLFAGSEKVRTDTPAEGQDQWMNDKLKPRDSIHGEDKTQQHFESTSSGKQFDPSENLRVSKHYDDIPFVHEKVDPQPRNPSTIANSENRLGTDESFYGFWGGDQHKLKIPKVKVASAKKLTNEKSSDQSKTETQ